MRRRDRGTEPAMARGHSCAAQDRKGEARAGQDRAEKEDSSKERSPCSPSMGEGSSPREGPCLAGQARSAPFDGLPQGRHVRLSPGRGRTLEFAGRPHSRSYRHDESGS